MFLNVKDADCATRHGDIDVDGAIENGVKIPAKDDPFDDDAALESDSESVVVSEDAPLVIVSFIDAMMIHFHTSKTKFT